MYISNMLIFGLGCSTPFMHRLHVLSVSDGNQNTAQSSVLCMIICDSIKQNDSEVVHVTVLVFYTVVSGIFNVAFG